MLRPTTLFTFVLAALHLAAAAPAAAQVGDHRDIDYPELPEFPIPRPEVFELDNGLRVFLLEEHELPLISASVRVRTGALWEPEEKTGLAAFVGAVQRTGGAASMTGDEIDDFLEARAASIETSISDVAGFASMNVLAEDFGEVLPLFVDILRSPRFDQDKLDIAKAQARAGIARRNDDSEGIAGREFPRLVYGADSPLSRMQEYATVAAITREDLADWHGAYFHPNNMLLGVVGDFDSAEIRKKIEAAFGAWPRGPEAMVPKVGYREEQSAGRYFIEKDNVTQAQIRMGHLGITVDNPDFFAVQVMNEVLSGGFSGRLMRSIRTEKGLAYGVGGGVRASFNHPGVTGFSLSTKSESMADAVDALYEEVEGMIDNPATQEELERAKETILNSFIFNYASRGQVLRQQLLYAYYGLPVDFLEKYRSNIEKVTVEDVARVAKAYLHPERATLLVVGQSADFGERGMSSLGEFTELDISIPPPPDTAPQVADTEDNAALGREVLAKVVSVMGGPDAAGTGALRFGASIQVTMQGQSMNMSQELLLVFPDRIRMTMKAPMGEQSLVIDGDQGFALRGGQSQPLPPQAVAGQLADLGRELHFIVRYSDAEDLKVLAAGEEEVEGNPCQVLAVSFKGTDSRMCVDAEGRVLKQAYQADHPFTGAPGQFEVWLSDYREVGGRSVPHKRVTHIDGQLFAESEMQSFEVDPEVEESLFEKPAA
jgi:predicted Zn-dependent peptidase